MTQDSEVAAMAGYSYVAAAGGSKQLNLTFIGCAYGVHQLMTQLYFMHNAISHLFPLHAW